MTDQRRHGIQHIAEINDTGTHFILLMMETVNVDDVSIPLHQEQETILRRINPMTLSATFGHLRLKCYEFYIY